MPFVEGRLKELRLELPAPGLKVNFSPGDEDLGRCKTLGREAAKAAESD